MNKILRIVGYVVLLLALAGTTVLFMQKNKSYKQTASFAEDAAKLMEENRGRIDSNNAEIAKLRNQMKYVVQSPALPLYEKVGAGAITQLTKGDAVYAYSIDEETGIARVAAENDPDNVLYETFSELITMDEGKENRGTVVISLEGVTQPEIYETANSVMAKLVSSLTAANVVVLYPKNQESLYYNWIQVAADCGADAHVILSIDSLVDGKPTCEVSVADGVSSEEQSQELKKQLDSSLAEFVTSNPEDAEEGSESENSEDSEAEVSIEVVEETEADEQNTESDKSGIENVINMLEAPASLDPAAAADNTASIDPVTCKIKLGIIAETGSEEDAEGENEDASESDEAADTESTPDQIDVIVERILLGLDNYLNMNR